MRLDTTAQTLAARRLYGRIAGGAYLAIMLAAFVYGGLVQSELIVPGDDAVTAANILANPLRFRLVLVLVIYVSVVVASWALFVIVRNVHEHLALLALLFRMAEAILGAASVLMNFAHPRPPHADALCKFLPCEVRFDRPSVGFEFPSAWLDLPIRDADPQLGQLLAEQASVWLATHAPRSRLTDRVRLWLGRNLRDTDAVASRLARDMKLSERTLRRKLSDEGTSIWALVAEARQRRASELLGSTSAPLDAIAYELGFSSVGAFCRAFKRWTGSSPTRYRAGL